jgi:hypothetical protein
MTWPPPSPYLTPHEASAFCGFAVDTLAHWRVQGKGQGYGPPYVKKRGRIRYPKAELEAWMRAEGLRRTTSDEPPGRGQGQATALRGVGKAL